MERSHEYSLSDFATNNCEDMGRDALVGERVNDFVVHDRIFNTGVLGGLSTLMGFFGVIGVPESVRMANWEAGLGYQAPLTTYIDSPGRAVATTVSLALLGLGAWAINRAVKVYDDAQVAIPTARINKMVKKYGPRVLERDRVRSLIEERDLGLDSSNNSLGFLVSKVKV